MKKGFFKPSLDPSIRLASVTAELNYISTRLPNRLWHLACPAFFSGICYYIGDPSIVLVPIFVPISMLSSLLIIEDPYERLENLTIEKAELEAMVKNKT